jgi:hypothetical protein
MEGSEKMVPESELDYAVEEGAEGLLSLMAGAVVGLLVGAALAVTLAPQPGKVTRAEVAKALSRLRSCLRKQPAGTDWES